jgi:hypothetical protein
MKQSTAEKIVPSTLDLRRSVETKADVVLFSRSLTICLNTARIAKSQLELRLRGPPCLRLPRVPASVEEGSLLYVPQYGLLSTFALCVLMVASAR